MPVKPPTTPPRTLATRGWVDPKLMPKGPRGFPLCRWCKRECPGSRNTFCGDLCVHEHKIRSNPGYLRRCVWNRDHGVCSSCSADTTLIHKGLLKIIHERGYKAMEEAAKALGYPPGRVHGGSLWDADHVVPVAEGGGSCGLEGIVTLCCRCHRVKTTAQAKRRALAAKANS